MERRATALKQTKKKGQQYTYYNKKLINDSYEGWGNIYDDEAAAKERLNWELNTKDRPYLAHVKSLADAAWPSLRLLADFMELGTSPVKWIDLQAKHKYVRAEIEKRASRTTITRLDYLPSGVVTQVYKTSQELKDALENESKKTESTKGRFRLYVVEDLSRDMIEYLGGHYDIEPAFFREQIFDYAWYNTRDRWIDPPQLNIATKKQRWLQLRFPSIRYYKNSADWEESLEEYEEFNVKRRSEDDINNKTTWDDVSALVGLARSRASLWISGEGRAGKGSGNVGVLLCDPTPKSGRTLWYGYRNWEETPSMSSKQLPKGPPRSSIYNDLVYWAKRTDAFNPSASHMARLNPADSVHVPIQALLHLISADWLEIGEYIRTRLGQIEWEISFPEHFLIKDANINDTLKKLHIWRRLVPLYREMLTETLQRAFQFPCHPPNPGPGGAPTDQENETSATTPTLATSSTSTGTTSNLPTATHHPEACQCQSSHPSNPQKCGPVTEMREDFERILGYMVEYQQRIDRLTSIVTAIISMQDSQRSREDNKNVARLTWLATFFIPLSFVASLFSMTEDISSIRQTIKWYFATSLPLALLSLGLAMVLTLPSVSEARKSHLHWWRNLFKGGAKKNQ